MDFPHRCTIERDQAAERDRHRARIADWQPRDEGVPCRLVSKQQRVVDLATGAGTIVTTYLLLLSARDDVTPVLDRVVRVTQRGGDVIEAGPFGIINRLARTGGAGGVAHISGGLELQGGNHATTQRH